MNQYMNEYMCGCYPRRSACCTSACDTRPGERGPRGPQGPRGVPGPFLSSYVECLANGQTIDVGGDVVFHDTDIVGSDIAFQEPGSQFTILRRGLYLVEWSLNLESAGALTMVGLFENGEPTSVLANNATVGSYSSGALIYADTVPYTFSLRNYGTPITIANPMQYELTAASIRVVRFADGPSR